MNITTNQSDNYCLITITGRLDSFTTPHLIVALQDVMASGNKFIIIDLGKIDFMSSCGILTLVQTQKKLKETKTGEIFLASVPELVHNSFSIAGFDKIFNFFIDTQSAIDSTKIEE